MRIAFLTHEPFHPPSGGGSAEAVYLVSEFVRRGHSVDVFGPELPDAASIERSFGIRLRPFQSWAMGRYASFRTPKYLAYPLALERLVLRHASPDAFDLIFSQHAIAAVTAGRLRRRLGIPVVMNFLDCLTGFMETWPRYLMPRAVARALVRFELGIPGRFQADAVLTVSDPLRDRFIQAGVPGERVHPIYYGFDARLFRRLPGDPPSATSPPVIVMHGSFDHHHLGPIARSAVVGIAKRRPDVRFRFIGRETPALRKFVAAVRATVPASAVECVGFTPYNEIPRQLAAATLGITPYEPSTGTHCAFVAKTVEYLALGLPVVSTPLESAIRYYQGLDGVRFSSVTGVDFAERVLEWLALSPDQRTRAVEPATRKVAAELDWSAICTRAVDVTEQVAATQRASAEPGPDPRRSTSD